MIDSLANSYRRLLVGWTRFVRRAAWPILIVALIVTVAATTFIVGNVKITTDTEDLLSPELPFRRDHAEIRATFPQTIGRLLIVIEGVTPDVADDAALALGAELRQRPEVFGTVFDPRGDPFFRQNGLLYLDSDEIYALSDQLSAAHPFLGALWRDNSLRGLFDMLSLAVDEALKDQPAAEVDIADVLTAMAEVAEAQSAGRIAPLSWRRLMGGDADAEGPFYRVLEVRPARDFGSFRPAAKSIAAIRDAVRALPVGAEDGVRVRLTGPVALADDERDSAAEGMSLAGALSFILVTGMLLWAFRSVRFAAANLVALVTGLIWTAAFAFAVVGALNLISVAFAVLFIGLSVDFGIHYTLRYREALARGAEHAEALTETATGVGGALTLCAVAAAIGFYSFLPTDYVGLAELGLIAGSGMFIALFVNVTVLPALLSVWPGRIRIDAKGQWTQDTFTKTLVRRPRVVLWSAAVVGVLAVVTARDVRFDFDPLNLKDPESESVSALFDLIEADPRRAYAITVLADDLQAAQAMADAARALPTVEGAETPTDYVPDDQDAKLDAIDTLALILDPAFLAPPRDPPTLQQETAALHALESRLQRLAGAGGDSTATAAKRLSEAFAALPLTGGDPAALAELRHRLLSGLPGRLERLQESLMASPVTLESLPADLRDRLIAPDGRVLVRIYPRAAIHQDQAALAAFVEDVRQVAPHANGTPVIVYESGRTVVRAFVVAAALAVVAIAGMLVIILRGLREVALVFAPLLLSALLTIAASVVMGIPFNLANIIVLPLLFGLGVAGAVHIVMRARGGDGSGESGVLGTSTPRAVFFSALTTIGSFASLGLSSHPGTASMGILLTVAIALMLICTLTVLPATLTVARPTVGAGGGRKGSKALSD